MRKTLNKKELCSLLNIGVETLKYIEKEGRLELRLNKIGYKLINRYKEGKSIMYIIELTKPSKGIYKQIVNDNYKTDKINEFTNYFKVRTDSCKKQVPVGKKDIADISNVSVNTISKWDCYSINNKIIKEDDYYYLEIDFINNKTFPITKDDYIEYWKSRTQSKVIEKLKSDYNIGLITLDQFTDKIIIATNLKQLSDNRFCFRVKKYKLNKDNELYKILTFFISKLLL